MSKVFSATSVAESAIGSDFDSSNAMGNILFN